MCIYIYTASSYANGLFLATGLASMSWLLSIALLWALGCVCLFIVEFLFFSRYTPRTGTAGSYDSSCSVTQSCPTLCDPMDRSTPGLPVHHQVLESTQTHVHWVGDAIQPSHPLSSPSLALNLSQHQGKMSRLFKWVDSLHEVAKALEFQFQYQSFQWIFRALVLVFQGPRNAVFPWWLHQFTFCWWRPEIALHSCDPPTTVVMNPTILHMHLCVYVCDFASVCESIKGNTPRSALHRFFLARSNFK